ncbi:MAG: N-acetyl-gamma-glutamyl-phosphate reductase [Candidatus Margulisiibacteriota bacterium]|nr:N-acetyl-gamma-glutamyl-phosphate reductase [Candidatus Margulisiibacteriota bacterium]
MIKIGIVGAGGYAGITLIQILLRHPEAKIVWAMSEDAHKGKKLDELYPHLQGEIDLTIQTLADLDKVLNKIDLVFLALPHGIALNYVPQMLKAGKKVVDLGADYRFNDEAVFKKWYNVDHKDKGLLKEAVFGLPEFYRKEIKQAKLIANPGCYPTAAILGLAPLIKDKLIEADGIVVNAASGTTGAGRGVSIKTHFCERNEGFEAYNVTGHRHMGEIDYQLTRISSGPVKATFVPHLLPMNRGILSTIYADIKNEKQKIKNNELINLYKKFYKNEPFVRIREGQLPNTKFVAGTNFCDIAVQVNEEKGKVIVIAAIDNLVKGAAGQAVHNMNLMCGFEETTGLKQIALYP